MYQQSNLHAKINSAQIQYFSRSRQTLKIFSEFSAMPFLGQDWRSPGDQWVRTAEGWEKLRLWRLKVFENLNENVVARLIRLALTMEVSHDRQTMERRQPYFFFNKGNTRERKELTSLSEALLRLDMSGAVKDIRRSNFVCKLLHLLLDGKLANLSGTAQKHTFLILEATVAEALRTELNLGQVRQLLAAARKALDKGQNYHIGSNCLWARHKATVCKLTNQMAAYQVKQRGAGTGPMLWELPEECVRAVLLRLPHAADLARAAQTAHFLTGPAHEQPTWRQLCQAHFSQRQMLTFLPANLTSAQGKGSTVDWKDLYRRCYKRFGKKDMYADQLAMCSYCCSIYWQSLGHPCIANDNEKKEKALSPEDFIHLFPL